jgi:hypothetical protein
MKISQGFGSHSWRSLVMSLNGMLAYRRAKCTNVVLKWHIHMKNITQCISKSPKNVENFVSYIVFNCVMFAKP